MKQPHQEKPAARGARRLCYTRRVLALVALSLAPGVLVTVVLTWMPESQALVMESQLVRVFLTVLVTVVPALVSWRLYTGMTRPLRTLANVLSGLREGDFSFQARGAGHGDSLAEVLLEVNALVETMRQQRLGALEATALLRAVMAEIDVAVFAFDEENRLRLVNRAGERLLGLSSERIQGRGAPELGLAEALEGETPRTMTGTFAGTSGRWGLHRRQFRGGGLPHTLLVISDLSRELREEERLAWQRLVRVMGHELNNSLAPVKSIAGSLASLAQKDPLPADWREDMRDGLHVIASRADALNRFVGAYAQLARLPKPKTRPTEVAALIARTVALETRLPVAILGTEAVSIDADADQLEQLVINLIRNAVDAVLERQEQSGTELQGGGVSVSWRMAGRQVEILVEDDGPGLANTANLFVPFFTTKQKGSGIGLVLCRQIAEGHNGSLALENRVGRTGCVATLRLPISPSADGEARIS